jgi:hypothetical protein
MEVEVEVPEHFEADQVRETMTRQMDNITFGGNLYWGVTERRVDSVRLRGQFW